MSRRYDVAIVGGGVVGCAIARRLSQFALDIVLIEAESDVGMGTSKANTAIFHTGFDADPGSLEAKLLRRSYPLLRSYCDATGIACEINGALMVAWTEEQAERLPDISANARANGVIDVRLLSPDDVYELEPHLGPGALGGFLVREEGIICPFSPVIAYAREAKRNGATFMFNAPVSAAESTPDGHALKAGASRVEANWVINAAGLHSDDIDAHLGMPRFRVTPRKGQLIVFDKFARSLVSHTILPIPTARTKGVLVSPTTFGNVLLGPTAEDVEDKTDTETSADGIASLIEKGRRIVPALVNEEMTACYAGLRAATEHKDYQVHVDAARRYVCAGGIRSTGLSASMGIAEHVLEGMQDGGLSTRPKADVATITMPPLGATQRRPFEDDERIHGNPDYGRVVCHCEKVTRGELVDAFTTELPPTHLDGLRRRTRCLLGRCQGFYCRAEIQQLLQEHAS
ncbi:MAG: FAD/NAD(P)-binding oxidoreductase [Phycisphaeraceae bacterium]|nr:FAD/NAD(P)-binding oxidoreductase [Phycisphaeraceae bacterium]